LQTDPSTGKVEGLSFEFNLCEAVASWEQVTMLSVDKSMQFNEINESQHHMLLL